MLQQTGCNLIVVSTERTCSQKEEYLKYKYRIKTQQQFMVSDTVKDAYSILIWLALLYQHSSDVTV